MRRAYLGQALLGAVAASLGFAAGDEVRRRIDVSLDPKPKRKKLLPREHRRRSVGWLPASINRNTGQPHEHKAEIARRQRQAARAKP